MILSKSFYIRWSAGRSPRVHEVNPGRDSSHTPNKTCLINCLNTLVHQEICDRSVPFLILELKLKFKMMLVSLISS